MLKKLKKRAREITVAMERARLEKKRQREEFKRAYKQEYQKAYKQEMLKVAREKAIARAQFGQKVKKALAKKAIEAYTGKPRHTTKTHHTRRRTAIQSVYYVSAPTPIRAVRKPKRKRRKDPLKGWLY